MILLSTAPTFGFVLPHILLQVRLILATLQCLLMDLSFLALGLSLQYIKLATLYHTAIANSVGQNPVTVTASWQLFTTGFTFVGAWSTSTAYLIGDVIRLGAYTYVATADNTASSPPNVGYWQQLNSGIKWTSTTASYSTVAGTNLVGTGTSATFNITASKTVYAVTVAAGGTGYAVNDTIKILGSAAGGLSPANDIIVTVVSVSSGAINIVTSTGYSVTWVAGVAYVLGDTVYFGANTYICVAANIAAAGNRPDADTTGTTWNLLASGAEDLLTSATS